MRRIECWQLAASRPQVFGLGFSLIFAVDLSLRLAADPPRFLTGHKSLVSLKWLCRKGPRYHL